MLELKLNQQTGVATLEPNGALSEDDFKRAARLVDPYIAQAGKLHGIIICAESFPGWDSFSALISHFKFVKAHHRKVLRIAFVTDSSIAGIAESMTGHFVAASIKKFAFSELEQANNWVLEQSEA